MKIDIVLSNWPLILSGAVKTLQFALVAWIIAIVLATIMAQMRLSDRIICRAIGAAYVEFLRNIPPIVLIFFTFFALPGLGIRLSAIWAVIMGVGLYSSAVMTEILRAGISAIPKGQYESAIVSGMSYIQAMRLVVLPQAIKVVVPPLGTESINLIKNTSLGAAVSAGEILGNANLIGSRTFAYTTSFIIAGAVYVILTWPAALAVNALERRLSRSRS